MRYIATALLAAILCATAPARAWEEGDEDACPALGDYANDYGFGITIPRGLQGCPNSPVEMSDHGVSIPLGAAFPLHEKPPGLVSAWAAYNVLEYRSARESASARIKGLRDYDHAIILSVSRRPARLGRVRAERVVLRYRREPGSGIVVEDSIVAVRSPQPAARDTAPAYEYSLSLSTPARRYAADRRVLERVLASWKFIEPAR